MTPSFPPVRFGRLSLWAAAGCFALWTLFTLMAGPPPSIVAAVPRWVSDHLLMLQLANEALFFGTAALVPGVGVFVHLLGKTRPAAGWAVGAAGAVAIPTLVAANLFLGRLVYPVFGLELPADDLAFAVSAYYGALHAFDLIAAFAVVVLGLFWPRTSRVPVFAAVSVAAAVAEGLCAYPWAFSPEAVAALRLPWLAWLVGAGLVLGRGRSATSGTPTPRHPGRR